jgi:predicted oxidoreductase
MSSSGVYSSATEKRSWLQGGCLFSGRQAGRAVAVEASG